MTNPEPPRAMRCADCQQPVYQIKYEPIPGLIWGHLSSQRPCAAQYRAIEEAPRG